MESWDVVIVGAGPAGAAAALGALRERPSARVLLLDGAAFPRDKVCGDGIAPHALDVLAGLGVDQAGLVAGCAPAGRLRLFSPGGRIAARATVRPSYVVPRKIFDHRLVEAAIAAGAVLRRHSVRAVSVGAREVRVDGALRAPVLIGADGAESVVRRAVGIPAARTGTVALAIRGYAPSAPWPAGEQLLRMTATHWPAYAWVFPIGDGRANVGYGEVLRGSPLSRSYLRARLLDLVPAAAPATLRAHRLPLSTGRPAVGHGRVLLAGDAAALINPLTGEGIFYAVLSGALAGAAAVGAEPGTTYQRALRARLGRHLRHTDLAAALVRRPWVIDAAVASAGRDQRAFDAFVELGLGDGRLDPRGLAGVLRAALARHG
ncbi:MAG TPA: NAD(P)/FAD-dependent oxidoreductase [Pseudonocardiaceae bacterium]|nr:NAD(P)/FAD-dependent oxidoreductase [Pseudonocardiaceae bacterium]